MSKELPYFKFIPTEYLLGTISFQKEKIQGTFILVCCHYWQRHCDITLSLLKQLLSNSQASVDVLIKNSLLKHNTETDKINIDFLDEQWNELSELHEKRSRAGSIGGQASVKQRSSIKIEIKKEIEKRITPTELENPFSIAFLERWGVWKKYKKEEHRFNHKSIETEQQSLNALAKLSGSSEEKAIEIINHTIANGWKGFVVPKQVTPQPTLSKHFH